MIATTDIGNGAVMMPAMVATKTANICQALRGSPSGGGRNHSTTPMATRYEEFPQGHVAAAFCRSSHRAFRGRSLRCHGAFPSS